jgi:hypothetical protein
VIIVRENTPKRKYHPPQVIETYPEDELMGDLIAHSWTHTFTVGTGKGSGYKSLV